MKDVKYNFEFNIFIKVPPEKGEKACQLINLEYI